MTSYAHAFLTAFVVKKYNAGVKIKAWKRQFYPFNRKANIVDTFLSIFEGSSLIWLKQIWLLLSPTKACSDIFFNLGFLPLQSGLVGLAGSAKNKELADGWWGGWDKGEVFVGV